MDIQDRSFQFAVRIVKLCKFLNEQPGVSRTLSHQLIRSGTSVGANIEEAQGGQSRADFLSKMSIALKEARETHYWLKLLSAADVVKSDLIAEIQTESNELVAILTTIVKSTKEGHHG
ncbi:MAG: four helix bundle protein [Pontiellaceae bacterium]|nr:four helix bundle protein [Pontiellaceae bacterium]